MRKISRLLRALVNILENNNNDDPLVNGENNSLLAALAFLNKDPPKKRVILDVGANVGKWSELVLNAVDTELLKTDLYLFEPVDFNVKNLIVRFGSFENVHILDFGLSDVEGKSVVHFNKNISTFSSLYSRETLTSSGHTFDELKCNFSTGLNFIKKHEISSVEYLKIDTDGHDLFVLEGFGEYLNPETIRFIQFEYGGANIDSRTFLRDFFDLLLPLGYSIGKIYQNNIEELSYSERLENFTNCNYLAFSKKFLIK